jgi:hypothetical protein
MKNNISNSQKISENRGEQSYDRKDEINLADYLRIILKRKYFIFLCSLLPGLLFGIILFVSPKNCKISYTYDLSQQKNDLKILLDKLDGLENLNRLVAELEKDELSAKNRKILLDSFFDSENLSKLAAELKQNGFEEYAQELSGEKIQIRISGTLLTMTVNGRSGQDLKKISSIVRVNFETNLLMYAAKQELSSNISMLKSRIAAIDQNKYSTELELDGQKTILTKLKKKASADSNNTPNGIVLQFDNAGENRSFLPWECQARAAEANIIYIEEAIRLNQKKNSRYKSLIELNEKLLNDISNSAIDNNREFHSFLINLKGDYQNTEFENYLNSYINKMENAITAYTALIENPKVDVVSKNILKKSAIVFLLLFIMTMFLTFLLEAVRKN